MTCKVIVQKGTFADNLAIVGRAVGSHSHLPILSNVLLNKDEGQCRHPGLVKPVAVKHANYLLEAPGAGGWQKRAGGLSDKGALCDR